jgi:ribonuclease P protein component
MPLRILFCYHYQCIMISLSHPYRLPPRLQRQSEFRRMKRLGAQFSLGFMKLTVCPTALLSGLESTPVDRVGFTISDHVSKSAVIRNRIKRMMREAVRTWWKDLNRGYSIVLSVGKIPRTNHASYVECVFLRLALEAKLVSTDAIKEAKLKIDSLPQEMREGGRIRCGR